MRRKKGDAGAEFYVSSPHSSPPVNSNVSQIANEKTASQRRKRNRYIKVAVIEIAS
jgi:hypothetical protein